MESAYTPISDIDNPLTRRTIYVTYVRVNKCEMIAGRIFFQLEGFHDLICLGDMANPPFNTGDLLKVTYEKVVQS